MFPLTIKDFPASVQDDLLGLVSALDLVPLKMTNDYVPELHWSVFADCDCLRDAELRAFLGISYPGEVSSGSFLQSPFECFILPSDSPVEYEIQQLEFDFNG